MADTIIGERIRKARKSKPMSQKALASAVGISASYLNMIEAGQRAIAGALIQKIALALDSEVHTLDGSAQVQTQGDLRTALQDLKVQGKAELSVQAENSLPSFAANTPEWAALFLEVYQQNLEVRALSHRLQDQASFDSRLAEIGHQILQHLTTVRSSAAILQHPTRLSEGARARFGDIVERESKALETMSRDFFERLEVLGKEAGPIATRRAIDNILHSNLNYFSSLEAIAEGWSRNSALPFHETRLALRKAAGQQIESLAANFCATEDLALNNALFMYFEQYVTSAIHMPYDAFSQMAEECGYDIDILAHQFGVSHEQVAHRLTTLRRSGSKSVAFAFMKVDAAGNVLKAYSLPEFFVPTSGSTCPKWPIYSAFSSGGKSQTQMIEHDQNGRFLTIAKSITSNARRFGAEVTRSAIMLVCTEAEGERTTYHNAAVGSSVSAGTACNICQFPNCPSRLRSSLLG